MVFTYWSNGSLRRLGRKRTAPNRAEGEKTGQRGKAENKRRLASREIRSGPEKLVDRLIAHIVRIAFYPISHASNQAGKLGCISIEVVRRTFSGVSKVTNHLRATRELAVQQSLHLVSDCDGSFRCGLFGRARCAPRGIRYSGERLAALFVRLPAAALRVTPLAVVRSSTRILIAHDNFLRLKGEPGRRELVPKRAVS
jgi:hypothetical protein